MNEPERRQRLVTSTPRLSPEEVAARSFGTKVRGYSEAEVRGFLKRVAEDMVAARAREEELLDTIDALEEQLRSPRPLSEQELLDGLGEETARLLRSAREASEEIRTKADERATEIIDEANTLAERVRNDAADAGAAVTEAAEQRAAEIIGAAEQRAHDIASTTVAESEGIVDGARRQGREMLEEAKAARERVLADLVRRRALLHAQIEELRTGRDRLLDAYRTVKRTFLDATEALAQVEAREAEERSTNGGESLDIAAEIAAEIEALDAAATEADDAVVNVAAAEAAEDVDDDGGSGPGLADVDSLFARIRAGHAELAPPGDADATELLPVTPAADESTGAVEAIESIGAVEEVSAAPQEAADAHGLLTAGEWRGLRAAALDPLLGPLVKKTKRTAQDDQNALLDAVRRHKGRPLAANVLPDLDELVASWAALLGDATDRAYAAGRNAAGAEPGDAPPDLARETAEAVVTPLRQRITVAIDSGEEGDTGGLVERIGARYREWKNQSLEVALTEALACAWSRGVYDAVPDGAILRWVALEEGQCSDCDDNALEPTVKGESFPTGQAFPPAHPGCRCLLAPATILDTSTASS
jgi:DivIVA domain-containing protein